MEKHLENGFELVVVASPKSSVLESLEKRVRENSLDTGCVEFRLIREILN